eukprot:m.35811 g.35811  ORF g.35811 m.35811 type:complete len:757 (+) comp8963_c0_seq1:237-2507(+)
MASVREGVLFKRAQGKSSLGRLNWKERAFTLNEKELCYYDQAAGQKKGTIQVSSIVCVAQMDANAFPERNQDWPVFQIVYNEAEFTVLYVQAKDMTDYSGWLESLGTLIKNNNGLVTHYHSKTFANNMWQCCGSRVRTPKEGCEPWSTLNLFPRDIPRSISEVVMKGINNGQPNESTHSGVESEGDEEEEEDVNDNDTIVTAQDRISLSPTVATTATTTTTVREGQARSEREPSIKSIYHTPVKPSALDPPPLIPNPLDESTTSINTASSNNTEKPCPATLPPVLETSCKKKGSGRYENWDMMETYIALYNFTGTEKDDLSFKKGEKLFVVEASPMKKWWTAQNGAGETGQIPANFVRKPGLESEEWFLGKISRSEAHALLKNCRDEEGVFLVRESETRPGEYALALGDKGEVRHYQIVRENDQLYVQYRHKFKTIPELIEYHKLNGGGLLCRLRSYLNENKKPPLDLLHGEKTICKDDLILLEEIGKGQFGTVHKAIYKHKHKVAVKVLHGEVDKHDEVMTEAFVMMNVSHIHLVQFFGVAVGSPMYIVSELMERGALLGYLRANGDLAQQPSELLRMSAEVASGMAHLEKQGFIHRDLAARNCLVNEDKVIKVADFGLTRYVVDDEYTASAGGQFPIKWSAPEVLEYCRFSTKSDVWAYGILLFEVYTLGTMPFKGFSNSETATKVLDGEVPGRPALLPSSMEDLLDSCWKRDPAQRPSFAEIEVILQTVEFGDYSEVPPPKTATIRASTYGGE